MVGYQKLAVLALIGAAVGFSGCSKKTPPASASGEGGAGSSASSEDSSGGSGSFNPNDVASFTPENILENLHLVNIYFDYDQSSLRDDDRQFLKVLAQALKNDANKSISLKLEGHADERGSNEYNLALGERRARSVNAYLTNLGVPSKRLDVVSFGEERPAELGSNESAWAKNRRVAFEKR